MAASVTARAVALVLIEIIIASPFVLAAGVALAVFPPLLVLVGWAYIKVRKRVYSRRW